MSCSFFVALDSPLSLIHMRWGSILRTAMRPRFRTRQEGDLKITPVSCLLCLRSDWLVA
jgi:hypothetical protein